MEMQNYFEFIWFPDLLKYNYYKANDDQCVKEKWEHPINQPHLGNI